MMSTPPPPARVTIEKMMLERVALYRQFFLTGRTVPVEVTPFPVDDYIPEGEKITEAVKRLQLNCSGGLLGIRADNLHQWLWEATRE